jgi:hypothetical protein
MHTPTLTPSDAWRRTVHQSPIVSIEFADSDDIRVRKVVTRSRARPTGKYPSWKMGRMMQWESSHECNHFRRLDAEPRVRAFFEQPCEIRYMFDGVEHRHYPDVLVEFALTKELREVKTKADANRPEIARRTELLMEALPSYGYQYRIVLAEDLAAQPYLDTAAALLRFGRAPVPLEAREWIRRLLAVEGAISWQSVLDGLLGPKGRNYICRLFLEGALDIDLSLALDSDTVIRAKTTFDTDQPSGGIF